MGAEREGPSGAGFQSEAIEAKAADAGQERQDFPRQVSFGNAPRSVRACSEKLPQSPRAGARDALWHCGAPAGPASSPQAPGTARTAGQLVDPSLLRCHRQREQVRSCLWPTTSDLSWVFRRDRK